MKTSQQQQASLILITALLLMAPIANAGTCSPTKLQALAKDTRAFVAKIKTDLKIDDEGPIFQVAAYPQQKKAVVDLFDGKFHKVDRSVPFFKPLDAVGVMTIYPFGKATRPTTYVSAVLISPCYVLTNRHVVEGMSRDRQQNAKEGSEFYFSVGQNTCNSKNEPGTEQPFKLQNLKAKLIDFGRGEIPPGALEPADPSRDWALLKLERPIGHQIIPVKPDDEVIVPGESFFVAGFPLNQLTADASDENFGFEAVRARYDRLAKNQHGVLGSEYPAKDAGGLSGGAMMRGWKDYDGNIGSTLVGLHRGVGQGIDITDIQSAIDKNKVTSWGKVIANQTGAFCE